MSDIEKNMEYTVGRGRVYFNLFAPGTNTPTGERYLGNTPTFSPSNEVENLDHYSAEQGIRQLDASVILQVDSTGAFTCDDISAENIALFFLGEKQTVTSLAGTALRDNDMGLLTKGRHYQLGASDANPTGVRRVDNVKVGYANIGATLTTGDITADPAVTIITASGNYEADLELGRVYIEPTAVIPAGKIIVAQYDVEAQQRNLIVGKNQMAYGSLRFIADNPVGDNKDYFYPKVSISPDGEYALKGDEWQVMGFTFKALKLGARESVYVDVRSAGTTSGADLSAIRTVNVAAASGTGTVGGGGVVVTATVRDGNNNVVAGQLVQFNVNGAGGVLSVTTGTTNGSGVLTTTLTAAAAATVSVTAQAASGGTVYEGTSQNVTFS
jgi:hypothetical protein